MKLIKQVRPSSKRKSKYKSIKRFQRIQNYQHLTLILLKINE